MCGLPGEVLPGTLMEKSRNDSWESDDEGSRGSVSPCVRPRDGSVLGCGGGGAGHGGDEVVEAGQGGSKVVPRRLVQSRLKVV